MAKGFTVTEDIALPPDTVWSQLSNLERAPEWMNGIDAVEPLAEGPPRAGNRYLIRLSTAGRGREREMELAAFDPPRSLSLASAEHGMRAVYAYRVEPAGDGSQVTLEASCEASGLVWRLMHPLIVIMMRRHDAGQLRALREMIEADNA